MDSKLEPAPAAANSGLAFSQYGELVFDDEPLSPLLTGGEPGFPTPTSAVERWRRGIERSEECARALMSVLANNKGQNPPPDSLDGAEECLRQWVESSTTQSERDQAKYSFALGRLLRFQNRIEEAERWLRRALALHERCAGADDPTTMAIAHELVGLLAATKRGEESTRLHNMIRARRLARHHDHSSLWDIRQVALEMFVAGQYAEAEAIYRQLLTQRFAPASTHCHLARLFLMTGREPEARLEVDAAWKLRDETPVYAVARTQFLRLLMCLLTDRDWKPYVLEFRDLFAKPDMHMVWTMQPVLDHLRNRLGEEMHAMLTALLAAIGSESKIKDLKANPTWMAICSDEKSSPVTESSTPATPATSAPFSPSDGERAVVRGISATTAPTSDNPAQMQLSLPTETTGIVAAPATTISPPEQTEHGVECFVSPSAQWSMSPATA